MKGLLHKQKTALALATTFALTACGGGGGGSGDDTPTKPTPPASEQLSIESAENKVVSRTLQGEPVSTERIRGTEAITAEASRSNGKTTLKVAVSELQNDGNARFKVTTKDGGTTIEYIVSVTAENTSAKGVVEQAERLTSVSPENLTLQDEKRLAQIALEIDYLTGVLDAGLKNEVNADIQKTIANTGATLGGSQSLLSEALTGYQNGSVTESVLTNSLENMNSKIQATATVGTTLLETVRPTLLGLGVDLPESLKFTYDENLGRYSRFTTPDLGAYDDNKEWEFHSEYDWLNAALPLTTETQL